MPDETDLVQKNVADFHADALREHWRRQRIGVGLSHCEECGGEIPEGRRRAMPTARHCVSCQTDLENETRRHRVA